MSENTEMAADHLGKWLSSPRSSGHETAKLVKLVNQLNEQGKHLSGEEEWELVADIADILAEYPLHLYPMRGADAFPKSRQFLTFELVSTKRDLWSIKGSEILNTIRVLLEHGELWRVKFCRNCGRYFRATRRRSAWCSSVRCEKEWRKHDVQFKKNRADKAFRDYWDMQTEGKTGRALREAEARRAKAIARRSRKGKDNEKNRTGSFSEASRR